MAANLLLAAILIFSAYGGTINPQHTTIGSLAAMIFPALLVFTLIVTAVNLIWFRRYAIVNILSLLACTSPILTICPLNIFRPSVEAIEQSGKPTLKILTLNTFDFNTFGSTDTEPADTLSGNPTLEYILDQDADIAVLQEAYAILLPDRYNRTPLQHMRMEQKYPYRAATSRGSAILSKYPFETVGVHITDPNQLDLLRYDVIVPGLDTLHVFNLHMQSLGLTPSDKEIYHHLTEGETSDGMQQIRSSLIGKLSAAFRLRAVQADDVRRAIDEVSGSVIVAGDFNDIPGCYAIRTIMGKDMTDAYRAAGLGPCITYHADRFYFRIDHILYRGRLDALRTWRGDCSTSDHYPLAAIFEIEPKSE